MSRFAYLFVLTTIIAITGWVILRPSKTVGAAESSEVAFGENTEEVAQHRWSHNAPRHWRSLMVKR